MHSCLLVNYLLAKKNDNCIPYILTTYNQINQANFQDNRSLDSDHHNDLKNINLLRRRDRSISKTINMLYNY